MKRCKLISKFGQEENNLEDEKISAIKALLTKNGSIHSTDKEIEFLLSEKNTNALKDNLGLLWDSQARLQERLSKLSEGASPKHQRVITDINSISTELKKSLYTSMNIIEDQKKKLIVVHELLRKKLKFTEGNRSFKDVSFKLALEELLEEKSHMVQPNQVIAEEDDEDTEYHSFREDPEKMKEVQKSFFQKNGKEAYNENGEHPLGKEVLAPLSSEKDYGNHSTDKSEQIRDEKEQGGKPGELTFSEAKVNAQGQDFTRKQSHSAHKVSFSLDKVKFQPVRNLLTTNPAFTKYEIPDGPPKRDRLPVFRDPKITINAWELLKQNLGKDLTKITMPVYLNEPLSMIQKVTEYLHYADCFRKANKHEDRLMRLNYVTAGFFMYYAHTIDRLKKPFNSLLGETYEYVDGDLRLVSEQISHHPPVCAFHAECDDFVFEGFFQIIIKFSMQGFQASAYGDLIITLKKTNERFTITRPLSTLHNYIVGKMYLWHSGDLTINNETTGDKALMYFKPKGWTSRTDYEAEGKVVDEEGHTHYHLYGRWNSFLSVIDMKTQQESKLVTKMPDIPDFDQQYYFSKFSVNLNYLTKELVTKLPMTDSRLRADQRAYEHGDLTVAADEKHKLEEAQRVRRKENEKNKIEHKPLWFEVTKEGGKIHKTKYKGGYWEARERGNWPEDMPNIMDA